MLAAFLLLLALSARIESITEETNWPARLWEGDGMALHSCKHGKYLLSLTDTLISAHLREFGKWEDRGVELLLQIILPGDIVIDGGANIGAFTIPFAKRVGMGGMVIGFEPVREYGKVNFRGLYLYNMNIIFNTEYFT